MPRPRATRIDAVEPLGEPALASFMTAREAPRVPFAALIERGLVAPGIKLVDAKRRHRALVRADGALALGESVGSIHRIGALAQGLEACNGWTFWHRRDAARPDGDRLAARAGARGDGGGLSVNLPYRPSRSATHRTA